MRVVYTSGNLEHTYYVWQKIIRTITSEGSRCICEDYFHLEIAFRLQKYCFDRWNGISCTPFAAVLHSYDKLFSTYESRRRYTRSVFAFTESHKLEPYTYYDFVQSERKFQEPTFTHIYFIIWFCVTRRVQVHSPVIFVWFFFSLVRFDLNIV